MGGAQQADRRSWALSQLGRTLSGRYQLDELRGIGGMGAVYVGRHLHVGRPVAIKLMLPHQIVRDREQLKREAQRAARVGGPGVVEITDLDFDEDGVAFLVMELLEGATLLERLERAGPLPPALAVRIALQVLSVLERAHERGLVHGDLKPSNLFLCGDDADAEVKVLDFGIAAAIETQTEDGDAVSGVRGTPAFMAPEQIAEGGADPRSDLYALGAVLYQALSGRRPYEGLVGSEILDALEEGPPHALGRLAPLLSSALVDFVERAMARDPGVRFQDAAEMRDTLDGLIDGAELVTKVAVESDDTFVLPVPLEPSAPRLPTSSEAPAPTSRPRGIVLAILLALGALAATVTWSSWPDGRAPTEDLAPTEDEPAAPRAVHEDVPLVLAPLGDRFNFVGVVVERSGSTARVIFADGDATSIREADLLPDTIVPGVCLSVRRANERLESGCVVQRVGHAVLVRMGEGGPPRWTSIARLTLSRDSAGGVEAYEPPDVAPGDDGSVVLADFQGRGGFYPGVITTRDSRGRLLVVYADGDGEWLEASRVRFTDIGVGTQVVAAPRQSSLPDPDLGPAIVLRRRGFALLVRLDDGREAWVALANVRVPRAELGTTIDL